jgi:hypothetical protein
MFVMVGHGEASTRINYYAEDGTEHLDKDDPYLFLRYEAADPASSKRKPESMLTFWAQYLSMVHQSICTGTLERR